MATVGKVLMTNNLRGMRANNATNVRLLNWSPEMINLFFIFLRLLCISTTIFVGPGSSVVFLAPSRNWLKLGEGVHFTGAFF